MDLKTTTALQTHLDSGWSLHSGFASLRRTEADRGWRRSLYPPPIMHPRLKESSPAVRIGRREKTFSSDMGEEGRNLPNKTTPRRPWNQIKGQVAFGHTTKKTLWWAYTFRVIKFQVRKKRTDWGKKSNAQCTVNVETNIWEEKNKEGRYNSSTSQKKLSATNMNHYSYGA